MNQTKTVLLTKEGLEALQSELKELKDIKHPKGIERVARAREFGDLSENSEYHAAREDLSWIEGRIEELQSIIGNSQVIAVAQKNGHVDVGCVVTVEVNGAKMDFHIVGEWEADPSSKKISHESPLGKALVGKKIGEAVEVEAPAGKVVYKIKAVK